MLFPVEFSFGKGVSKMLNIFLPGTRENQSKQGYVHGANWSYFYCQLMVHHCVNNIGRNSEKNLGLFECETIVLKWRMGTNKEMELKQNFW